MAFPMIDLLRSAYVILLIVGFCGYTQVCAQVPTGAAADAIAGVYWSPSGDAQIAIEVVGGELSGRIIAVKPERQHQRDEHNPDHRLRTRPVLGLVIFSGFRYDASAECWLGGRVYDPKQGRTYRGRLWLDERGALKGRGYVGLPLFGRTETFKPNDRPPQPPPKLVYYGGNSP